MQIDRPYWRDVNGRGEATILVGAGIRRHHRPTSPLAAGLVASLIAPVLQPLSLPSALARSVSRTLVQLRPEVITDVLLVDAARPLLDVLRGRPNTWHAWNIYDGRTLRHCGTGARRIQAGRVNAGSDYYFFFLGGNGAGSHFRGSP